ncbi:hypothetical protein [Tessaracoccus sp. Z1128]
MKAWTHINTWTGYLVFGVPAAFAALALLGTLAQFGVWDAVTSALIPAVLVAAPLLLWIRYVSQRPTKIRQWIGWIMVATLCLTGALLSPLWGWAVPGLLLLASEAALAITGSARRVAAERVPAPRKACSCLTSS